jgi:predicted nucleotidyltransferase
MMAGGSVNKALLTAERIQACLLPVFVRYQIDRAILFGSVARGEASRHSDVDLILVQRTTKRFLERYEGLLYELNAALPEAAVEVLIYTPEELERMRERRFIARALREGVVIYERQ